jgi:myosin heavy subunit
MAEDLILNELEAKIRTLDEYKAKIEELRTENNDLLTKLQTKEQDAMEVIKYLRAENDSLQERLRIYSEESATAKSEAETTVRTANEERDRAIAEMEAEFKRNEGNRELEVDKLRKELFALKAFKDRKEVLEGELERVHQELHDVQAAHKEAMTGVERKLIEEKTRLQKEAHAQLMEIKRNTDEEVVNRLDVSTKRILQQNRRLAEDLKLHVQETAELQRVKAKLEEDTKRLRRDLELNEQQMNEYAQDRLRHTKQTKDLQSKVKNLEKSLAQVVKDFERERERLLSKGKVPSPPLRAHSLSIDQSHARTLFQHLSLSLSLSLSLARARSLSPPPSLPLSHDFTLAALPDLCLP